MGVRHARSEDMDTVAKINVDSWQTAFRGIVDDSYLDGMNAEKTKEGLERGFGKRPLCVYEDENGHVLGSSIYGDSRDAEVQELSEYTGELRAIHIDPEYKGQGIGKEIFKFVASDLKNRGHKKMYLWVFEKNLAAIRFYEKMGGKLIYRCDRMVGDKLYASLCFGYDL